MSRHLGDVRPGAEMGVSMKRDSQHEVSEPGDTRADEEEIRDTDPDGSDPVDESHQWTGKAKAKDCRDDEDHREEGKGDAEDLSKLRDREATRSQPKCDIETNVPGKEWIGQ